MNGCRRKKKSLGKEPLVRNSQEWRRRSLEGRASSTLLVICHEGSDTPGLL